MCEYFIPSILNLLLFCFFGWPSVELLFFKGEKPLPVQFLHVILNALIISLFQLPSFYAQRSQMLYLLKTIQSPHPTILVALLGRLAYKRQYFQNVETGNDLTSPFLASLCKSLQTK